MATANPSYLYQLDPYENEYIQERLGWSDAGPTKERRIKEMRDLFVILGRQLHKRCPRSACLERSMQHLEVAACYAETAIRNET